MEDSVKKILLKYIEEKDFSKYNDILVKEIISFFVKKIQGIDNSFVYSNLIELLENVEIYLDSSDTYIFNYFYCQSYYDFSLLHHMGYVVLLFLYNRTLHPV